MSNIMEIIVRAVDQASNVFNNIGKLGEQATKNLEKSFKNAGKAMTNAGKTLSTTVTAPLAGLATVSVATVAKFDDSMSQVAAISGATGNDLEKLRDLAKDLGATTRYSASEAADAMTYLALAGYDTNQILGATPGMLNLAAAAGMDLATAADIVTDTMSGFQMSAEKAGEAADIFAAASSKSNTNVEQLGEAMKYASSTANAAGMDLAQTAAVLGVLADSGIKGSMAGTTFNAMLRDLKKANAEGKLAIEGTTIALYNQDGSMRDLGAVMADMEKATKGMTTAQRDAALSTIFGEQAIRGANILLATGSKRYKELEQAMYDSTGASQKMAETMEDNVAGAFRAFKSQMEGIMIQIGEQLAPVLRDTIIPLLSGFGEKISNLIKWFAGLDEGTKRTILTILGIAAAVGPVLIILGKIVGAVGTIIGIFSKLKAALTAATTASNLFNASLLANPITWIIVGIMALIAAIVLLWKNWDTVSKWLSDSWEWIKAKAEVVFGPIAEYLSDVWNSISETISEVWGSITEFLTETWNSIVEFMRPIFQRMAEFLSTIWEGIKTVAMAMWNVIVVVLTEIWEGILEVVTPIFEKIAEFFSMVWEGIKEVTMAVWEFIVKGLTNLWNAIIDFATPIFEGLAKFFTGIWEGIKRVTTAVWESIRDTTVAIWKGIVEFITPIWEVIKETASTIFNAIKDVIQAIWSGILEITSTIWETIKGVLSAVWEGIKTLAQGNFDSIKEIIDIIWNTIKTATETVWNGIKTVLTTIWKNIKNVVDTSINAVKTVVESVWNVIKTITSAVWNGITNVVTGTVNGLKNAIGTAFNWIKDKITSIWNGIKNTTKSIWDSMVTIIKAPVNGIINIINGLIGALNKVQIKIPKVPDWIPGIGGKGGGTIGFNIPKIPMLARGGFIKGGNPTPAVIGEGRYDEAVIPLNDTVLGKLAEMIASRMGTSKAVEHRHFGTLRVVVENAQQGFEEIVDVVINEIRREVRA